MTWAQYDGVAIRLQQKKTGKRLVVPLTAALRDRLDTVERAGSVICLNSHGKPWTADGFKTSFAAAKAVAIEQGAKNIATLTFHDTRGTAVVNMAIAGCTVPEIASITGHSLKDAETILETHYLGRDHRLGESAISKVDKHANVGGGYLPDEHGRAEEHPITRSKYNEIRACSGHETSKVECNLADEAAREIDIQSAFPDKVAA